VHVIELNDAGVTVSHDESVLLESPGCAIVDGNQILVGEAALRHSRLNPRASYDRFWEQLSLDPLPRRHAKVQHHADLAYHHLAAIWEQVKSDVNEVIFAVPGSFSTQQLGLLLGIARACAIPAAGLIDAALAAASTAQAAGKLWHLDVQLHRVVLTEFDAHNHLMRTAVHDVARRGLVTLREIWANTIAEAFLREARFDPLHRADSEQALYDHLPHWLASYRDRSSAVLELKTRHRTHRLTLSRARLTQAATGLYDEITNNARTHLGAGEPSALLVSHRLHELPGALEALAHLPDCEVVPLDRDATARGAVMYAARIRSDGEALKFVTRLPLHAPALQSEIRARRTGTVLSRPTHVLHQGRAYPIADRPLIVGTNLPADTFGIELGIDHSSAAHHRCTIRRQGAEIVIENLTDDKIVLNGQNLTARATAEIGDMIRIGAAELQLIAVVNHDGT
jgi:hypothetical protein